VTGEGRGEGRTRDENVEVVRRKGRRG